MTSKKNKNNNIKKTDNNKIINKADDMEEVDKILEMIDEMEKNKKKSKGGSAEMSSRVKNLIKEDKEAIREMQEKMKVLEDDLDYLDDEKTNDTVFESTDESGLEEKDKEDSKNKEDAPAKEKSNKRKRGKGKNKKNSNDENNENFVTDENTSDNEKTESEDGDRNNEDDEEGVKLDFFANLERKDKEESVNIYAERIRKKQPNKLKRNSDYDSSFIGKIKKIAVENTKNFMVGTAIAFLFIALMIALVIDSNSVKSQNETEVKVSSGDFIEINTAGMIDAVNNYFKALSSGEKDAIKKCVVNPDKLADDDVTALVNKAEGYSKLVGDGFKITDCYVQSGLNENEYICYFKFEIKLKSIETPAVGMFTCYLKDVTKEELEKSEEAKIHIYRIDNSMYDKATDVYKYVIKMSSCKNVTELFNSVNDELSESCEKDADLKSIVDALNGSEEDTEVIDEETTQAPSESKEETQEETKE